MKLSSSFQMPKFSSSSSPMSWRLYGEDCGKVTKDVNLETIEPMYTQNYDPLSPPNPYTSERDLEDMLLDRSLRYMDKALLSKVRSPSRSYITFISRCKISLNKI